MKTKFDGYICFSTSWYDTTPEADDEKGMMEIPTVTLDGSFTLEDLESILKKMKVHHAKSQTSAGI